MVYLLYGSQPVGGGKEVTSDSYWIYSSYNSDDQKRVMGGV